MNGTFTITIDGAAHAVAEGTSVASALLQANAHSRISLGGEPRQPLCGMGICYECRVTIDERPHQRSCQILCEPGMRIVTAWPVQ